VPSRGEFMRFAAAVVGVALAAALFAITFRSLLALVYQRVFGAATVVEAISALPTWLRVAVPAAGGLTAGILARLRSQSHQGVSNVMEAVVLGRVHLSFRTTVARVSASFAAIASGMSIGREGPLIEFGGTLGAVAARVTKLPLTRTRVLVAAGTAAGFTAAYNTPFAAVLFVLETIVGIAALEATVPTIAATVIASALTRAVVGGGPIYGQRSFTLASPWELLSFAVVGGLGACGATLFKRMLAAFERLFERQALPQPWRAMLGGLIVGLVATAVPSVVGNGFEPLNQLLNGPMVTQALIVLLFAKVIGTSGSVASGVPGGIFTPVLLTGGILGALWAHVASAWHFIPPNAGGYALVGMAATTAASIHAPLTAAVLVFELSGDYAIVLPLLLATVVATSVSRWLGADSVYEAELKRRGHHWTLTLEGRERIEGVMSGVERSNALQPGGREQR
jgi:chloride channel protein, CIC family